MKERIASVIDAPVAKDLHDGWMPDWHNSQSHNRNRGLPVIKDIEVDNEREWQDQQFDLPDDKDFELSDEDFELDEEDDSELIDAIGRRNRTV